MFVAASSRCFSDESFEVSCERLTDLEFDKIEIWMDENSDHLKPSDITKSPEDFCSRFREATRLTPIAFCLENDISPESFQLLCKTAKMLRIAQITIPASPLGTPFNSEIDRLKRLLEIASHDGICLSIKTKTGQLTEDPRTATELCQSVKGLGITLDPSYYTCGPYSTTSHDLVYPYVCHVHLRDSTKDELQVPVGLGELDYSRVISLLERQEYHQFISVELLPALLNNVDRALELRKLRLLLESVVI
ncbi:MAG: TIM barrel protein [Gimesia sp.]